MSTSTPRSDHLLGVVVWVPDVGSGLAVRAESDPGAEAEGEEESENGV